MKKILFLIILIAISISNYGQILKKRYLPMDTNYAAVLPSYIDTFRIYDNCDIAWAIQYPLAGKPLTIMEENTEVEIVTEDISGNQTTAKFEVVLYDSNAYPPTPLAPDANILGYTTLYDNEISATKRRSILIVSSDSGWVRNLSIYHSALETHPDSTYISCAIYLDTDNDNIPDSRISGTGKEALSPNEGWQHFAVDNIFHTKAGLKLWFTFVASNDNVKFRYTPNGFNAESAEMPVDTLKWIDWNTSVVMPSYFGPANTGNELYSVSIRYQKYENATPFIRWTFETIE